MYYLRLRQLAEPMLQLLATATLLARSAAADMQRNCGPLLAELHAAPPPLVPPLQPGSDVVLVRAETQALGAARRVPPALVREAVYAQARSLHMRLPC
jgi:hypothetical protein